jgi:hypothetical protein
MDCAASYISMLENAKPHSGSGGRVQPSEAWIETLARTFGCPLSEARLMAGYSAVDAIRADDELARIIERIPPERRPSFLTAVRAMADAIAA